MSRFLLAGPIGLASLHRIHNSAAIVESYDPNEAVKSVGLVQRQTKEMLLDQSARGNYRDAGYALAAIFGMFPVTCL